MAQPIKKTIELGDGRTITLETSGMASWPSKPMER